MYPYFLLSIRRVCLKYKYKHKSFVDVIGVVGSGKNTMINIIIGEGLALHGMESVVLVFIVDVRCGMWLCDVDADHQCDYGYQ